MVRAFELYGNMRGRHLIPVNQALMLTTKS